MSTAYTVCPHDCPDTCGALTEVRDGRAVAIEADPAHPVTAGWLCAKVNGYLDLVNHPGRLGHPLRRRGPKDGEPRWERISWQAAITEIAARWGAICETEGPEAILPYSFSGTLGLVQMTVCNERLWNRMGASRLIRSICGAANERAVRATLGARLSPPYPQVLDSRMVILWGHNPVSTAPHFAPWLRRARRAGCYCVVIDPRRTRSARGADLHLAPRPGTDAALALAMAHVICAEGLHDEGFLEGHTLGWAELRERLAEYPPGRAARVCGIEERAIVELARRYATARPSLIKISDGLNRNRNGGQSARAVCALPALTGQYGVRGGGLMYSTTDTWRWHAETVTRRGECPPAGRAVNMNRLGAALCGEVAGPPIRSLYVWGANPAASTANAARVVAGLRRAELFTVVHELFMTDTAALADIVLPATCQLEHADLHRGYGHHLLAWNEPALAPPGECRSNWDVMRALAAALGYREAWLRQDATAVAAEILAASAAQPGSPLAGLTLERLRAEGPIELGGQAVPFAGGRFPTPSGRVELYSERLAAEGLDPLPGWSERPDPDPPPGGADPALALELISPAGHHFVSSSFANRPDLARREGRPALEIHPADADARGIRDGQAVRVANRRGWCVLRARVSDAVRPGVVASTKGWWPCHHGGRNVNWTTPDALGDLAGQSTYHSNRVWLSPA